MRAALVLVDLQNAFCSPGGSLARRGYRIAGLDAAVAGCMQLRDWSLRRGIPAVLTRLVYRADYADAGLLVGDQPAIRDLGAYANGSEDSALIAELALSESDCVVDKRRYDPFVGTDFESSLRKLGVAELLVAGLLTNVCVESTVRSAYDRDFRVTVAADATASYDRALHRASLATLERHFARVRTVAELIAS
jgi:ureidoacrylate peracid hydrolase